MLKKLITPTILVLVAGLSWWYIQTLEKALMPKPAVTSPGPDYFMFDTVSTVLNQSGEPEQQLVTAYLAHFPGDNRTELKDAHLTLHQTDGSQWSIKANSGTLYQDTKQIFLSGQVTIEKPQTISSKNNLPQGDASQANILKGGIKIETERIRVDANRQIAETEEPVKITGNEVQVHAIGMKANLQAKTVELLANVRGTYAPDR